MDERHKERGLVPSGNFFNYDSIVHDGDSQAPKLQDGLVDS